MKIPKEGALKNCNNWRGITLLSVPSKILAKIIIQRIAHSGPTIQKRASRVSERKEMYRADFHLAYITEQCTEWQRQLCINFVDFEKAFDSVHRESLWRILQAYGMPQQIIDII